MCNQSLLVKCNTEKRVGAIPQVTLFHLSPLIRPRRSMFGLFVISLPSTASYVKRVAAVNGVELN